MRLRYLRLGIGLVLLALAGLAYIGVGMRFYGDYRVAYAGFRNSCDELVSWNPPTEVFTGLYVNQPQLLTIRYHSPTPRTLRISLSIPELTQEQSFQVQASSSYRELRFKPPILGTAALDSLVGPRQRQGQIRLRISDAGQSLCDTSTPVVLKSRQWMHWYDPVLGDNASYLASWVTPQAPVIRNLIGEAAVRLSEVPGAYAGTAGLRGYDQGRATAQDVTQQVNLLFDTLQFRYGVRYANDNVPYNTDASQLIQLPADVLSRPNPTAMCLETTAILASAIELLGMRPYFVIVPGHAFLGVAVGPDPSSPIEYWETSDLNGATGSQANVDGDLEFERNRARGEILRVIDVQYERELGIGPIE